MDEVFEISTTIAMRRWRSGQRAYPISQKSRD